MEDLVASINGITFDIESIIENQTAVMPLYFAMMDKSNAATCNFFLKNGGCNLGRFCPYRHVRAEKMVVCKHWLRGLCKKGDDCEFLHVYDQTKMPECYFHSKLNSCTNKECTFLHVNSDDSIKECPWYNRGFCRRGPNCRLKHIRRILCQNYLNGFCPNGLKCNAFHAKFYVDWKSFKNML